MVFSVNERARHCYESVGFKERCTETGAFSYHDEVWDRCNMVLKNANALQDQNPWESISLDDYEKHMSLDSVQQLQKMNSIMKDQFEAYPVKTAMVLGIAGGNGLEHVKADKYRTVYGVDINEEYLSAVSKRYEYLGDVLQCVRADLTDLLFKRTLEKRRLTTEKAEKDF